jgi:hypothetical protein
MWYVNQHFDSALLDTLPRLGFQVRSTGGVMRIEKYGCAAELRRMPDSRFQMTILPSLLMKGQFTLLWDAGYQKFFITDDKHKVPALAEQLGRLRRFNEELRSALGVPAYYNEALGSTSQISVYDRVQGRPGDIPDETVGVLPDPEQED